MEKIIINIVVFGFIFGMGLVVFMRRLRKQFLEASLEGKCFRYKDKKYKEIEEVFPLYSDSESAIRNYFSNEFCEYFDYIYLYPGGSYETLTSVFRRKVNPCSNFCLSPKKLDLRLVKYEQCRYFESYYYYYSDEDPGLSDECLCRLIMILKSYFFVLSLRNSTLSIYKDRCLVPPSEVGKFFEVLDKATDLIDE